MLFIYTKYAKNHISPTLIAFIKLHCTNSIERTCFILVSSSQSTLLFTSHNLFISCHTSQSILIKDMFLIDSVMLHDTFEDSLVMSSWADLILRDIVMLVHSIMGIKDIYTNPILQSTQKLYHITIVIATIDTNAIFTKLYIYVCRLSFAF